MIQLFVSLALAQDTVTCTATDGSGLVYEEWHKSGGAAPGPETVMDTTVWRVGAAVITSLEHWYSAAGVARGRLDWAWDPTKTVVLAVDPNSMHGRVVYQTEVRVWTRRHEPIHATIPEAERTVPMRCERVKVCCIP